MIRKLITRVFGKKPPNQSRGPSTLSAKSLGISKDQISQGSRRTVETLQQHGYEAFVVGGAVRDLLAGIPPKDFDVATNATPEQVRRCFRRSRIIGRRFQIVHVLSGQETIEVTTFRGHHGTQDNQKAQTDAQGRVLRDNVFGSQQEDADRRDFTVNALYYDPTNELVIDYHHGVTDIQHKTLRMIGDPKTRYREDPVRMLRAIRLSAKLNLSIEPETKHPIKELAGLIENIPPSRLFDETLKLLTSGHAVNCIQQLRAEGLHHGLLPLIDVILNQPLGEKFVMLALANTDARIREGKRTSAGFLFATLLWHEVLKKWQDIKNQGERPIPALFIAMDLVLEVQAEKLAITRRIASDIKEIWALQPRFDQRVGKKPFTLLEHPRFRASYDFLLLRAESGEIEQELGSWWTKFYSSDFETRHEMLLPPKASDQKKRRRRRKKPASAAPSLGSEE